VIVEIVEKRDGKKERKEDKRVERESRNREIKMREERKDVIMYKIKSRVKREVAPLSGILWP
jgi:hypothetical protein